MKILKGDNVIMRNGKDAGKSGKVLFAFPDEDKLIVEGLNMVKKHVRARKQGQQGQVVSRPRKVSISSVQLVCPKCSKRSRVGYLVEESGKKRICKKCKAEI